MAINLTDPNLDFGLEEQLLKAELLRNKELQQRKEAPKQIAGTILPWSAGTMLGNTLSGTAGKIGQRDTEESMRGLSAEQQSRLQALRGQLTPTTPIDMSNAQAIAAENARKRAIYQQMGNLPMGQEEAKLGLTTTTGLPNTLAQKVQGQGNLTNMQNARFNQANQTAATTQANTVANNKQKLADQIALKQWELDNQYNQSKLSKARAAAGGKTTDQIQDETDMKRSLSKNAEMFRSMFTFEEGEGYEPTTEGISSIVASVIGDKVKYLGMDKTAEGVNQLENLKGKVTSLAKELMSESGKLGNMAVQEWEIITNAIAKLDPLTDNFDQVLAEIKTTVNESYRRNVQEYADKYGMTFEEASSKLGTPESEARRTMSERDRLIQQSQNRRGGQENTVEEFEEKTLPDGTIMRKYSDGRLEKVN